MLNIKLRQIIFLLCVVFLVPSLIILSFVGTIAWIIKDTCNWCAEKFDDFYIWSKE